jgi:hypothetical protein
MDAAILRKEALQLPEKDRALLADTLLASLSPTPTELEAAWASEADERLRAFQAGELDAVEGRSALAALRAKFPR